MNNNFCRPFHWGPLCLENGSQMRRPSANERESHWTELELGDGKDNHISKECPILKSMSFPLTVPNPQVKTLGRFFSTATFRLQLYAVWNEEKIGLSAVPHCKAVTPTGFFNPHVLGSN